eukprot:807863-Pelagomonas_calceolata.AAC.1
MCQQQQQQQPPWQTLCKVQQLWGSEQLWPCQMLSIFEGCSSMLPTLWHTAAARFVRGPDVMRTAEVGDVELTEVQRT